MSDAFRDQVLALLEDVDPAAAERYGLCGGEGHGRYSECSQAPIGSDDPHPFTYIPYSCMLRICPRCAKRLAEDLRRKYDAIVADVLDEQGWKVQRGWRIRHVTLTTSYELAPDAGDHVITLLDAARDAFHATWGRSDGAGAVASVEVGERGHKWHVHMLVWGPYIDHGALSSVWEDLTGCSVVWLRECGGTVEAAEEVVGEVLKYATKFVDLAPEMLVDLHLALKGRRRVRSWGSFYGSGVEVEEDPEVCSECGARMILTPEWAVAARLKWAEGGGAVFSSNTANKSAGERAPPPPPERAPRPLGGGVWSSERDLEGSEAFRAYADGGSGV